LGLSLDVNAGKVEFVIKYNLEWQSHHNQQHTLYNI